jgi:hypothetical protein
MSEEQANPDGATITPSLSKIPTRPSFLLARLALAVSFCAIGCFGGWLIYGFWIAVSVRTAVISSSLFVLIMAGVHFLGYRLWRRQFPQSPGNTPPPPVLSSEYSRPVKAALVQQGIVLILGLLMLDGGLTLHMAMLAVIAFWLAFGIVIARRPLAPTRSDLFLVRYGFLLAFVTILIVAPYVWKAMGRW